MANNLRTLLSFQATLTAVHFHVTDSRFIDERISTRIQELRPQPESISNHSSPPAEETVAVEDVTGLSDVRSAQASPLITTQTGVVSTTNFANVPTFSGRHVKVEFTVEQNAIANVCSCSCHWLGAMKTPNWLANAVGMLLIRLAAKFSNMYANFMQDMQQNYFEKSSNILLPSLVDDGTNHSTRKWLQCIT